MLHLLCERGKGKGEHFFTAPVRVHETEVGGIWFVRTRTRALECLHETEVRSWFVRTQTRALVIDESINKGTLN